MLKLKLLSLSLYYRDTNSNLRHFIFTFCQLFYNHLFYNESIFSFLSCFREYYYRFVTIRDDVSGLPPICTLVGTQDITPV